MTLRAREFGKTTGVKKSNFCIAYSRAPLREAAVTPTLAELIHTSEGAKNRDAHMANISPATTLCPHGTLAKLPLEVRREIWHWLMPWNRTAAEANNSRAPSLYNYPRDLVVAHATRNRTQPPKNRLAVLRTSRALYKEITQELYHCDLQLCLGDGSTDSMQNGWMMKGLPGAQFSDFETGPISKFKSLTVSIACPSWGDVAFTMLMQYFVLYLVGRLGQLRRIPPLRIVLRDTEEQQWFRLIYKGSRASPEDKFIAPNGEAMQTGYAVRIKNGCVSEWVYQVALFPFMLLQNGTSFAISCPGPEDDPLIKLKAATMGEEARWMESSWRRQPLKRFGDNASQWNTILWRIDQVTLVLDVGLDRLASSMAGILRRDRFANWQQYYHRTQPIYQCLDCQTLKQSAERSLNELASSFVLSNPALTKVEADSCIVDSEGHLHLDKAPVEDWVKEHPAGIPPLAARLWRRNTPAARATLVDRLFSTGVLDSQVLLAHIKASPRYGAGSKGLLNRSGRGCMKPTSDAEFFNGVPLETAQERCRKRWATR